MSAVLGTNIASLLAAKNLQKAQFNMANSVERLSSGLRINRGKDDAAGIAIADSLQQQINGANQGIRNLNDGVSIVQIADGALSSATEIAQRLITLGTQASSGVLSTDQYANLSAETLALSTALTDIVSRTKFSGTTLFGAATDISIMSSNEALDVVTIDTAVSLADFTSTTEGSALVTAAAAVADTDGGAALVLAAGEFLATLDTQRATLGSLQNRLESNISNVSDLSANLSAARSRIIDVDYSTETSALTKGQILQQAATAMLAQANQMPNVILSLLK